MLKSFILPFKFLQASETMFLFMQGVWKYCRPNRRREVDTLRRFTIISMLDMAVIGCMRPLQIMYLVVANKYMIELSLLLSSTGD